MQDFWAYQKARELERELAIRQAERRAPLMAVDRESRQAGALRDVARLLQALTRRPVRRMSTLPGVARRKRATGS